jgi:hypothetical protein
MSRRRRWHAFDGDQLQNLFIKEQIVPFQNALALTLNTLLTKYDISRNQAATLGDRQQARRFVNKKGKDVIAITAPIYNEPDCYNAACHIHKAEQKILGTLDIGLSAAPLDNNTAVLSMRVIWPDFIFSTIFQTNFRRTSGPCLRPEPPSLGWKATICGYIVRKRSKGNGKYWRSSTADRQGGRMEKEMDDSTSRPE